MYVRWSKVHLDPDNEVQVLRIRDYCNWQNMILDPIPIGGTAAEPYAFNGVSGTISPALSLCPLCPALRSGSVSGCAALRSGCAMLRCATLCCLTPPCLPLA